MGLFCLTSVALVLTFAVSYKLQSHLLRTSKIVPCILLPQLEVNITVNPNSLFESVLQRWQRQTLQCNTNNMIRDNVLQVAACRFPGVPLLLLRDSVFVLWWGFFSNFHWLLSAQGIGQLGRRDATVSRIYSVGLAFAPDFVWAHTCIQNSRIQNEGLFPLFVLHVWRGELNFFTLGAFSLLVLSLIPQVFMPHPEMRSLRRMNCHLSAP